MSDFFIFLIPLNPEKFIGNSMPRNLELIEEMTGALLPESFVGQYLTRCKIALETYLQPVKDIKSVLEEIKFPFAETVFFQDDLSSVWLKAIRV